MTLGTLKSHTNNRTRWGMWEMGMWEIGLTSQQQPPVNQQIPNMQIVELLAQQQQHTLALTLPSPKVPVFSGNPIDLYGFIQAFEQLIESKTNSNSARLYYLMVTTNIAHTLS